MRDLTSILGAAVSLAVATYAASADGDAVDLQGFDSALVLIVPGTITDGTHTLAIQESDDGETFTAVAAADLQGEVATLATNTLQQIGYIGTKRYLRVAATAAETTDGGVYGALVIKGNPSVAPVA